MRPVWIDEVDRRLSELRDQEAVIYYKADLTGKLDAAGLEAIADERRSLIGSTKLLSKADSLRERAREAITRRKCELLRRQIRMSRIDDDPALLKLRGELEQAQYDFKPEVGGKEVTYSEMVAMLTGSEDTDLRRAAHESMRGYLEATRPCAREVIRRSNFLARGEGFATYAHAKLEYQELTMPALLGTLAAMQDAAEDQWKSLLGACGRELGLAEVPAHDLPYAVRRLTDVAGEGFLPRGLQETIRQTVGLFGMDMAALPIRIEFLDDLPHLGAVHALKVGGDIRVLMRKSKETFSQYSTVFHELGHAIYYSQVPRDSSLLLDNRIGREGLAELWAGLVETPEWLERFSSLSGAEISGFLHKRKLSRCYRSMFWFIRETLFELAIYEDPDVEFGALWEEVTRLCLGMEDTSGVYSEFVFLYPLDMKDYAYAELVKHSILKALAGRFPTGIHSLDAMEFMLENYYRGGNLRPWHARFPGFDSPGVYAVFNPSPAMYDGKTILLLSMAFFKSRTPETRVAVSDDGIRFTIADEAFINLDNLPQPFDVVCWNVIDSRLTQIGETYYILTPVSTLKFDTAVTILGKTKDFRTYELIDIVALPRNRGASLFPERIGGKYYRLDRPGAGTGAYGTIWLSSSPDLTHWGSFRPLLHPGYAKWNGTKIGPTPPIRTEEGWLVIVHGVRTPCDGAHYYIGAVLLNLDEPWRIIGKTHSYLLAPEQDYETRGHVDNVVFPCGAIADHDGDELRLYYGAADTRICLATGRLSEVVQACVEEI